MPISRTLPTGSPAEIARANDDDTHWLAPVSAVAALAVGTALQVSRGVLHGHAIGLLALALLLLLAGVVVRRPAGWAVVDATLLPIVCTVGLILQIAWLYTADPGRFLYIDGPFTALFNAGLAAMALLGGMLVGGARGRRVVPLVLALVAVHFVMGASVIRHSPDTFIDVDVFQRQSVEALLRGLNPYAITFPNIYNDASFYAPGIVVDGQLQFGFPYFPLSLLAVLPAEVLAGDHRYAALAAIEISALLMAFARPKGFGVFAAVLYLTSPRIFFVVEYSWTEPIVTLGLAAVVFAACRNRRVLPWVFGAFIALKQYLVFALPAALLLLPAPYERRAMVRLFGIAALVAAVITVPFFLWNPDAFIRSVVTLQFYQPFRGDSLSFLAWGLTRGLPPLSSGVAFGVAAVAATLAVWRLPRTAAGFGGALSLTFFGFFAFNKQAFSNYYFFVIGALCTTLAACARTSVSAMAAAETTTRAPLPPRLPRTRSALIALGAVVAASLLPLAWPGDSAFINDEPRLIAAAADANTLGRLAERGLSGTLERGHGPLPTWVYQGLVGLSHDLVLVTLLHTMLLVGTTAIALWWLSRTLDLWIWFAPVPLLSPYFWFYSRVLSDSPFLMPLGALALAGYAAHLRVGSKVGLRISMVAVATIPLVHLIGLTLAVPLATHMGLTQWRALKAERASVTAIVATLGIVTRPYWQSLVAAGAPTPGVAELGAWLFPLTGGRLLSARALDALYGSGPIQGPVMEGAAAITSVAFALVWAGIAVAAWHIVAAVRQRRTTPRMHIAAILLAAVFCQMVFDGVAATFALKLQNAAWLTSVMLAWFSVDWLATRQRTFQWAAPVLTSLLASALVVSVVTVAYRLHQTSGTRDVYGPTLSSQQQVARVLARYSTESRIMTNVIPLQRNPQALSTLRQLNAGGPYRTGQYGEFEVRYTSPDPASGAIEVVAR